MEIEGGLLAHEMRRGKSKNQLDYMDSLQSCLKSEQLLLVEIVRTKDKVDSTLKVILNHKLSSPSTFKQIVICCEKERDACEYFDRVKELSTVYPEIMNLSILKMSTKKRLCIDKKRGQHDEELYCRFKRRVDAEPCIYYQNLLKNRKNGTLPMTGLFDDKALVKIGIEGQSCPNYHQDFLTQKVDIIICEHSNIFKESEKHKDICQFLKMDPKSTFLFLDQSQYLYEDIQSYHSFHLDQDTIQVSINKCRSLKKTIYNKENMVKKSKIEEIDPKYNDMLAQLKKGLQMKLEQDKKKQASALSGQQLAEQITSLECKAEIPEFAFNPILLIDYIENISFELNTLFEHHFSHLKQKMQPDKKSEKSGSHHHEGGHRSVESMLKDLKAHFSVFFQLRLILDTLFSFMFKQLFMDGNHLTEGKDLSVMYIISDFIYFFSEHYCPLPKSNTRSHNQRNNNNHSYLSMRCFFQDHPEFLRSAVTNPILTFTPAKISPFSKRIFESCKGFALTSDCIIQKRDHQTTKILGLEHLPIQKLRFGLDPEYRFNVMPLLITKWNDQSAFLSTHRFEDQALQLRNYVNIVNSICEFVPDGIVTYLPNVDVFLRFLDEKKDQILSERPIFFESPFNPSKTLQAFEDYKKSCNIGKGALFFCEANGWARRHIQFKDHYARAVLILGYPARKEFYRHISEKEIYDLPVDDFYTFDTITRVASCLKSVYTDTKDYCTIILADQKLRAESDFLPTWTTHNLKGQDDLTVDDLFQKVLEHSKCMGRLYQ